MRRFFPLLAIALTVLITLAVFESAYRNYNTVMEVEHFLTKGMAFSPDVIVLNYFINDAEPVPSYEGVDGFLVRHSYAWVYFGSRIDAFLRSFSGRQDWQQYYHGLYKREGWQNAKFAIQKLAQFANKENVPLIIVNYPELRQLRPYPFDEVRQAVEKLANNVGADYIDLYDAVKDVDEETLWVTRPDPHPNANASKYYSEELLRPVLCKLSPAKCN